ncbi:hypothetical protein [Actinoalloteichus hymeniacidonis]|uniref:Uncharacterized protein n=1 Tax=Actinoalloteichus hymeniacidonis TaxID=340345 RepID=A0AAC9HTL5_9PSEU|nr:hypothetical protein [Actinoalloteichus hymeniacidonis]AOS65392.1 hypothetical protein TL08_23060 [Actinoalloteichus hymeniacidonis]MBB5906522.1 hypothetical protein [Actinoalloteichus hymeniacidonis]
MGDTYEIYFGSAGSGNPKERFAELVSAAIDAPLQPDDDPYRNYWAERDGVYFDLYSEHGMDNDAGIPFEQMPYSVTLRSDIAREEQLRIAEAVFERLREAGLRPIYLVWGIERTIRHAD